MKNDTAHRNQNSTACDPAELFNRLGPMVYGYALGILRNPADAQDVLGETFLRICKRKDQYSGQGSIKAWVLTITRRLCFDLLRGRARRTGSLELAEQVHSSETPSMLTEKRERREIILVAIDKLSDGQRDVVMLKTYGGLTFREISQMLGIPLNTALGRMHDALNHLRRDPGLAKIGPTNHEL